MSSNASNIDLQQTDSIIGSAVEGVEPFLFKKLLKQAEDGSTIIHVASDDARAERVQTLLKFFAPTMRVAMFPAWDCLPYDRVSPAPDIEARRVAIMTKLASGGKCDVIVTTLSAMTQLVPPPSHFKGRYLKITAGQDIDQQALTHWLIENGFHRTETVRETGEFAIRGNLIDLYPPGVAEPVRLDLFGQTVENIRRFDPLTQRRGAARKSVTLLPFSEVQLDEECISRFRSRYREYFGAVRKEDPLYESVSSGVRHQGMEHFLPLFHDKLVSLAEYVKSPILVLDHQISEAYEHRIAQVKDFFEARQSFAQVEKKGDIAPYHPLPPDLLYVHEDAWEKQLRLNQAHHLSPFAQPGGIDAGGKAAEGFAAARAMRDLHLFDAVAAHLNNALEDGKRTIIAAYSEGSAERLTSLLSDHGFTKISQAADWAAALDLPQTTVGMIVLPLEKGFTLHAKPYALNIIAEQDILGERLARAPKKQRKSANFIGEVSQIQEGDLIVHSDHGVGRYEGLQTMSIYGGIHGAPHDFLCVVYHGGDKLYVPVENIELLTRYGSDEGTAQLDRLGGAGWQARKAKVKKDLMAIAGGLVDLAAKRLLHKSDPLSAPAGMMQEFNARFPYTETEDQQRAIAEVIEDLSSSKPMDRLVCGDVGFGKTEVALRAAFAAAMGGKQVAVVVPTTLLARQHTKNFKDRFAGFPIRIGQLSRLVTAKQAEKVKDEMKRGTMDIVIGTHALLAGSVGFKDLGLVIVDEEQHFGVKQKEKLKTLRANVHVLTMTATPIPRTLQLSLAGVRELSLITTPPVDRLAVRSFVIPFDPVIIREAIMREKFRGGQSFVVCPRLADLPKLAKQLGALVPEVKIAQANGQMPPADLEKVMTEFDDGAFDVLLATNIIESGLDVPSANTLIIHRADMFGLAQLYQLRGRVGRSKQRGYAYFTYTPGKQLTKTAMKRLEVISTLDQLGAGFQLASHDLDIRGAGNLLGEEQSGHIKEVGVELFQHMLEEAVASAKAGGGVGDMEIHEEWSPHINLGLPVLIPETYVHDLGVRMDLYHRLSEIDTEQEIEGFAAELIDRFGKLPVEVENLLKIMNLKRLCKIAGIAKFDAGPKGAVLQFYKDRCAYPEKLMEFIASQVGTLKLKPDHKLVYSRDWPTDDLRMKGARSLLKKLSSLPQGGE